MFIIIKDKNELIRYSLSHLKDISYKGIFIYFRNNNYYISLKNHYYFIDHVKIKKLELGQYLINCEDHYYNIELFVYDCDKEIDQYDIYKKRNFILANSKKADIYCYDEYLKDKYLIYKDGYIQSNYEIILNGQRYKNELIKQEDVVEYGGIRIIFFDDFLYINNFNCHINISKYPIYNSIIKYEKQILKSSSYQTNEIINFEIDKLDPFIYKDNYQHKGFLRSIIPNMVMAISMSLIAGLNYYNSSLTKQNNITRIVYLIMPACMIVSNIFIPFIFLFIEKRHNKKDYLKKKTKYLNYLNNYEKKLIDDIDKYVKQKNNAYFILANAQEKLFYAHRNHKEYLHLSLGKITESKEFEYDKTIDEDINIKLEDIKNRLSYIDDVCFNLNLNKYRIITIVTKQADMDYFFDKFLLELSYKHHYDDLKIALYSTYNDNDEVYNLPHLFIEGRRLLFRSIKSLQELDCMDLNIPVIVMMNIKCDYLFKNPNIHIIYFSNDLRDIYRNSECIIEYRNYNAYIYEESINRFVYYQQDYDFKKLYNNLGRYQMLKKDEVHYFSEIFSDHDIKASYCIKHHSLKADFAYSDNELISFDLHESKQGPHGLIGGATGSGKSELIVSMLLSMCMRYSPEYLNIILIDYKGGGILESLSYDNIKIPHIIASITNLENNVLERLIIALKNECDKRQILFRKLSEKINVSIMNIDEYLDNDYLKYGLNNMAHLLIVVDEFAQLKRQHPEQIKELISISRIGRSLGLHLILSTQRPSGNIDEEIWSNSRFKLSLKVFEEKDSLDILKIKDAAYLKNPGEFLLRVDEHIIKARSVFSKNDINGNEPYEISLLDESFNIIKKKKVAQNCQFYASSYYCNKIIDICKQLNIKAEQFDYQNLIPLNREKIGQCDCLILGQKDDYINNDKSLLKYELFNNLLLYSTRKNEINMILNTFNENKKQTIVISDKQYINNYISDCIEYDDIDSIDYLFRYLDNNNPELVIIIEDLNLFLLSYEKYLDRFIKLVRKSDNYKYNFICLTSYIQLSYRIINLFRHKIMIEIDDKSDVAYFYGTNSKYKADSYYFDEQPISFMPLLLEEFVKQDRKLDNIIRHIPETIYSEIKDDEILLGYDLVDKEKIFVKKDIQIVSFNQKLLDKYAKAYDINVILYDNSLKFIDNYLWLGPGIFMQRLFVSSYNNDLKDNEAILFLQGKKIMIRSIDDV